MELWQLNIADEGPALQFCDRKSSAGEHDGEDDDDDDDDDGDDDDGEQRRGEDTAAQSAPAQPVSPVSLRSGRGRPA